MAMFKYSVYISVYQMMYERGSLHRHEELKEHILSHPEIVGIEQKDIIEVQTETPLQKRRRTIFAKPDITIIYNGDQGIRKRFVEIKSGSCKRAKDNLMHQLRKIEKFIRHQKMHAEVIGVYPLGRTLELIVL